jgi:hypothetical protein
VTEFTAIFKRAPYCAREGLGAPSMKSCQLTGIAWVVVICGVAAFSASAQNEGAGTAGPSSRNARWSSMPPVASVPAPVQCSCLDIDVYGPPGHWQPIARDTQVVEAETVIRVSSHCRSAVRLLAMRDANQGAIRVPAMQPTAGRTFALETLKDGNTVLFDMQGSSSNGLMAISCPVQNPNP